MSERTTAMPPAENVDEKETQQTNLPTDEGAYSEDVEKEEGDDYFAQENARLQAELGKKDEIIDHKNRAIQTMKKKSRKDEQDDTGDEVLKPNDMSEIEQRLIERQDQKLAEMRLQERENALEDEIMRKAESKDHADVIRYHLAHSVRPTGNIREDVENAQWFADKRRFMTQDAEKTQALISKSTSGSGAFSGHKQNANTSKYKPTPEDKRIAERFFGGSMERYLKNKNPVNSR